jgi:ATP-dependent DNA helicase RecQ
MTAYIQGEQCLMMFLTQALDDPTAQPCGQCAVCLGHPLFPPTYTDKRHTQARQFLQQSHYPLVLKRQIPALALPDYNWSGKLPRHLQAEPGQCLSIWGDAGWGQLVKQGKFQDGYFDDDLVEACDQMIQRWRPEPFPTWITCVPSLSHPVLVPHFTQRLAQRLNLPFVPCIQKTRSTQPQKLMNNSFQQLRNLDGAFTIDRWPGIEGAVFLVDDMVDSGWTLTILAALLREAGSGAVFPIALADSSSMG